MRLLEGDENLAQFSSVLHCIPLFYGKKRNPKMISEMLGVKSAM